MAEFQNPKFKGFYNLRIEKFVANGEELKHKDGRQLEGGLVDDEGRPYAFASAPADLYHYDALGRICNQDGHVIIP